MITLVNKWLMQILKLNSKDNMADILELWQLVFN